MSINLQALNYLVDAYQTFAGNNLLRSLCGAGFPLFVRQMFVGMKIQYASTSLGCVAIALAPIPIVFTDTARRFAKRNAYWPVTEISI